MNLNGMEEILDKIKNQSTVLVVILLCYTYFALKAGGSIVSPLSLSGFVTLFLSVFLALANFLYIQISEGYKTIIGEFKGIISNLKSQQKFTREHYTEMLTETKSQKEEVSKDYTVVQTEQTKNN